MKTLSKEAYNKLRKMEVINSDAVREIVFSHYKPNEITKPKIKKLVVQDFRLQAYPENEKFPFTEYNGHYVWTATVKESKKVLIWKPFKNEYFEVYNKNVNFQNGPLLSFDDNWLLGFIPIFSKLCRIYQIEQFVCHINNDELHNALNCGVTVSLRKHIIASRCFELRKTSMKALYDRAYVSMSLCSDMTGHHLSNVESYTETYDKMTIKDHINDVDYTNLPELYL